MMENHKGRIQAMLADLVKDPTVDSVKSAEVKDYWIPYIGQDQIQRGMEFHAEIWINGACFWQYRQITSNQEADLHLSSHLVMVIEVWDRIYKEILKLGILGEYSAFTKRMSAYAAGRQSGKSIKGSDWDIDKKAIPRRKYNYWYELAVVIDQVLNVIAGGRSDSTISARVGKYSIHNKTWYWVAMRAMIDFTFRPMDGKNHCVNAYLADKEEDTREGNWVAQATLAWLTFGCCSIIAPVFWLGKLIRKVTKKDEKS